MIANLIAFYKKNRLILAYFIMWVVLFSPYLDIIFPAFGLREKLLSAIPLFLLFLLNDWRTEADDKLKRLEQGLNNPEPRTFGRFPAMEEEMGGVLKELVTKSSKVTIKVISVSSKFSRRFLLGAINELLKSEHPLDLDISILLVSPEKLDEWGLNSWSKESIHSIDRFIEYLRDHKKVLGNKGIRLTIGVYDNLPHWHGVMFNEKIFFMGRTEWFRDGDNLKWELKVGEVEYRRFEVDDTFGGKERIDRFTLWHNRYLDRARQNSKIFDNDLD